MGTRCKFAPEAFKGNEALEIAWSVGSEPKFHRKQLCTKEKICRNVNILESCDAIIRVAGESRDGRPVAMISDLGIAMSGVARALSTAMELTMNEIKNMFAPPLVNFVNQLTASEPRDQMIIDEARVLQAADSDFGTFRNIDILELVQPEEIEALNFDADTVLSVYNQERNSQSASITLEHFRDADNQDMRDTTEEIDPGIFNSESQELPSMQIEEFDALGDAPIVWPLGHQINTPLRTSNVNGQFCPDANEGIMEGAEFNRFEEGPSEMGRDTDHESVNDERPIERGRDADTGGINELDSRRQMIHSQSYASSELEQSEDIYDERAVESIKLPHVSSIHVPDASQQAALELANRRRRKKKRLIIDQAKKIPVDRNFDYYSSGEHQPFDCILPHELQFLARNSDMINKCGRAISSQRLQTFYTHMMKRFLRLKNLTSPEAHAFCNALDEMRDASTDIPPLDREVCHQNLLLGNDVNNRVATVEAEDSPEDMHNDNCNSIQDNIELGDEIVTFVEDEHGSQTMQQRDDPDVTFNLLNLEETVRIENNPANTINPLVEESGVSSDSDSAVVEGTRKRVKQPINVLRSKTRHMNSNLQIPSPLMNTSDKEDHNMIIHHSSIHLSGLPQNHIRNQEQNTSNNLMDANLQNSHQASVTDDNRDDAASDIGSSCSESSSNFQIIPRVHIPENIILDGALHSRFFEEIFVPAITPRNFAAKAFLKILNLYGIKILLEQQVTKDTRDSTIYPIRLRLMTASSRASPDMAFNSQEPN